MFGYLCRYQPVEEPKEWGHEKLPHGPATPPVTGKRRKEVCLKLYLREDVCLLILGMEQADLAAVSLFEVGDPAFLR